MVYEKIMPYQVATSCNQLQPLQPVATDATSCNRRNRLHGVARTVARNHFRQVQAPHHKLREEDRNARRRTKKISLSISRAFPKTDCNQSTRFEPIGTNWNQLEPIQPNTLNCSPLRDCNQLHPIARKHLRSFGHSVHFVNSV